MQPKRREKKEWRKGPERSETQASTWTYTQLEYWKKRRERSRKIIQGNDNQIFPNLLKNSNLHVQEVLRIPSKTNKENHRHIRVKMQKVKDKDKPWKKQDGKQVTYKATPIRLTAGS